MTARLLCLVTACLLVPGESSASPPAAPQESASYRSAGRPVRVDVTRPAGAARHPAVVLLHGRGGMTLYRGPFEALSGALVARGLVVLTPHYFDATASADSPEVTAAAFETWRAAIADALTFAAQRPDVDPERIAVVGVSLGGFLAGVEAVQDARIAALVTVSAGVSTWFPPRPRRMPRLLIVHSRRDPVVPLAGAMRLADVARDLGVEPEIELLDGDEHVPTGARARSADARIVAFLARTLRSIGR